MCLCVCEMMDFCGQVGAYLCVLWASAGDNVKMFKFLSALYVYFRDWILVLFPCDKGAVRNCVLKSRSFASSY